MLGKKACWERARLQLEGKAARNSCYVSELEAPNQSQRWEASAAQKGERMSSKLQPEGTAIEKHMVALSLSTPQTQGTCCSNSACL